VKVSPPLLPQPPQNQSGWRKHSLIGKTLLVSLIVIATNVLGNYALKRGLDQVGTVTSWSPVPYIQALAHPWVAIGVVLMLGWLISRLVLLSWADLTYVLPVTSFSFALSAMTGAFYLNEEVSNYRWAGISLVTLGILLVVLTYPETTPEHLEEEEE
jgi:uncharacterized membrane protein